MSHPQKAREFLREEKRADWHNETLWWVRKKRDTAAQQIPEWETLRTLASQIKDNVLSNLDNYLIEFERKAKANGIHVHWACDASEHNRIVSHIIKKHNASSIVKSKSILTEECKLNEHLEKNGYRVVDTDLGERIIQFAKQPPSHIVMPAIHLKKEQISDIFHQHLETEKGNADPKYLTDAARVHLRHHFLSADVAITGVNFGIVETGGFVVCTNEGNADMGVHLAPVHIACMGIEKLIPKFIHLGVFTRILARSATGQAITNYTSHFHQPREGQEMHIILVDNGRTKQLSRAKFKSSLKCIRCGACMNTCPIYRRSGGHSYQSTVPGPIGSILSPGFDLEKHKSLPFASTLCGSCTDVCPVKIDIHQQLYEWRQEVVKNGFDHRVKFWIMDKLSILLGSPGRYISASRWLKKVLRILPASVLNAPINNWTKARNLPKSPKHTFKEWYAQNRKINE
jgi:L-lactate dehydrogenase complex protein LldF